MAVGRRFAWNDEKVRELIKIKSTKEFKSLCAYKAIDFSSDKPAMYEAIRKGMSEKYIVDFGPKEISKSKDATP